MTVQELHDILAGGERLTLECKKAESKLPDSIWSTYSAFANTYGGLIVLGVEENVKEKSFTVKGVDDADKICKELWNLLNNRQKVSANVLVMKSVEVVESDGKSVVVIDVPQAAYNLRPIYINNNMQNGSYKRNHEGDYKCNEQELKMMLRDANDEGNDGILLENYGMEDIDGETLRKYRQLFKIDHPEHAWNDLEDKEFLRNMGGYGKNRNTGTEALTLAGLLMFGKGLSVRERFSNVRMDYVDYTNISGEQRYSDRLTYDGSWENNLFNFIRMVLPKLTRDLPRPFKMEGMQRIDDTPLHKAVREAVTNAVIHSDYMLNGVLRIEKHDEGFVLKNPGLLKLPVRAIYEGGESKSRNPRMQDMLRMIGYGENLGSGFPSILKAWHDTRLAEPMLVEQTELMQVELTMQIVLGNNDFLKDFLKELTERQIDILKIINTDFLITTQGIADKTGTTDRTARNDIKTLND